MITVKMTNRLFYENIEHELSFPKCWQVDGLENLGLNNLDLTPNQIHQRVGHPIDCLISKSEAGICMVPYGAIQHMKQPEV